MKGFLRSTNSPLLQLAPKVTTVGRSGCDITIQSPNIDPQHALIEWKEEEGCFILQDLNSSQGTYVNSCRVQNAAVRLASRDSIRFGHCETVYHLEVDEPAFSPKPATYGTISRDPYSSPLGNTTSLPLIPPSIASTHTAFMVPGGQAGPLPPKPPSEGRGRPVSAGVRRQSPFVDITRTTPPTMRSAWGAPGPANPLVSFDSSTHGPGAPDPFNTDLDCLPMGGQPAGMELLRELTEMPSVSSMPQRGETEDQLLGIPGGEENRTVVAYQGRIYEQAMQIVQLKSELTNASIELKKMADRKGGNEGERALKVMEEQLNEKKGEVDRLRDQMREAQQGARGNVPVEDFNEKAHELQKVKGEMERLRKDKNITTGLVTQMQKDMSNKDTSISQMSREIEALKKKVRERDVEVAALNAKFSRVKATHLSEQELEARDKELLGLRQQFKSAESKVQEQKERIAELKREVSGAHGGATSTQQELSAAQSKLEETKSELTDVQRAERTVRVDLEQATKRFERFRNRVIQVSFSTPGVRYPEEEVKDEDLMEAMKKVIDERSKLQREISDLKDKLKLTADDSKKANSSGTKLKDLLQQVEDRLRESGLSGSSLRQVRAHLQGFSCDGNEVLQTLRDKLNNLLTLGLNWQQDTEEALELFGVNAKLSTDPPSVHIKELQKKWESSSRDKERVDHKLATLEDNHSRELHQKGEVLREEMANKVKDAVDQAQLAAEERLHAAIEEIKSSEQQKLETSVDAERSLIAELQANVASLQSSLTEAQSEGRDLASSTREALEKLKAKTQLEEELKQQLVDGEVARQAEISSIYREVEGKDEGIQKEVGEYREQTRQHAVTICTMEEKLNKVMKKNKDLLHQISSLNITIKELKTKSAKAQEKSASPPLSQQAQVVIHKQVTPDFTALQQTVEALRKELLDAKRKSKDQSDVILGMKRDIAGAEARMSDMAGELSEGQKQELERNRAMVKAKEREISSLQQKLAQLSKIVDSQSDKMKTMSRELDKSQNRLGAAANDTSGKDDMIRGLQERIKVLETNHEKQAEAFEEEGKIKAELTSQGAACRGERHQLILERQREALGELRRRVKDLELNRPTSSKPDTALQQVNVLKRELADMKSSVAAEERTGAELASMAAVERAVNKARGITSATDGEAEHERSAHLDTAEALEESENSYLELLRGVASCLELRDDLQGLRPMAHLPMDERIRLGRERETAAGGITSAINGLKESLIRKDELLQNYERDLARLRRAELLTEKRAGQVDEVASKLQEQMDECVYLRELLNRTKDRLNKEKRLNAAIKEKKTFHLENERGPFVTNRRHACPPEDLFGKETQQKKRLTDRMKRKNYELRSLKTELVKKDEQLCETTTRLINLENDR